VRARPEAVRRPSAAHGAPMERLRAATRSALRGRFAPVRRSAASSARHSAPDCSAAFHCANAPAPLRLRAAAHRRLAHSSAEAALAAVPQALRSAPPGASAQQAAALPLARSAASDAAVALPRAADAVEAPQDAEQAPQRAAQGAEEAPQQAAQGAVLPQVAPGAAPQQEVRVAEAARAEVRRREARGAAGRPWAAPDAPAALPSAAAWVFRRDRLRWPAP
jgi:hypothetical protein